jgi:4-hydroxy-tetrahydrodipicolinate synthase
VVIISVGAESSKLAEDYARHAEKIRADAVMAIPPVSVILDEVELAGYSGIIRAIGIPVIVQDASGYVGRPMSIAMQARLLDEFGPERVMFKPEATPIIPRLVELLKATEDARASSRAREALRWSNRTGTGSSARCRADLIKALVALWKALEAGDKVKSPAHSFGTGLPCFAPDKAWTLFSPSRNICSCGRASFQTR